MATGAKDMYQLADEFIHAEQKYVDVLTTLNHLEIRLKKHLEAEDDILMDDEIKNVFINSSSIYNFNADLVQRLNKVRWGGSESFITQLPDILIKDIQFFKMYGNFIKDVRNAEKNYVEYYNKHKDFKKFMDLNEKIYNIPAGEFKNVLTAPVQRLPKYIITFGAILTAMPTDHPAYSAMQHAVQEMQAVMDDISDKAEATMRSNRVLYVQSVVFKRNILIVEASRKWYRTSRMKIKDLDESKKQMECVLHLFNDCILYSTKGILGGTNLKGVMLVAGLQITPILSTPHTFKLSNPLTKAEWEVSCVDDDERDNADSSYLKWLSALIKVYNLHYNIFEEGNRPANPTTTSNSKILHPEDLAATIKKKTVTTPRYIDRPPAITHEAVLNEIDRLRKSGTGGSSAASSAAVPTTPQPPSHIAPPATPGGGAAYPPMTPTQQQAPPSFGAASLTPPTEVTLMTEEDLWNNIEFPVNGWDKVWDDSHGQYYYQNMSLSLTQWEVPQDIVDAYERIRDENIHAVNEYQQALEAYEQQKQQQAASPPRPVFSPGASVPPQPPSTPLPPSASSSSIAGAPPPFTPGASPQPPSFGGAAPPPTPSPAPTAGAEGQPPQRNALLSAISAGATLKKVNSDDSAPAAASSPPRNPLLAGISGGVNLKKVDQQQPVQKAPPQEDVGGLNIGAHLKASLDNYRKYVQDDGSDDDYDDEDW